MNIKFFGREIKRKDFFLGLFFLFFWILPYTWSTVTLKKITVLPRFMTYLYSTSNLFTHATYIWPMPYIQVLPEDGDEWETLEESDFFRMQTFGYRTRLFELLYYATNIPDYKRKSYESQKELAIWVAKRYRQLYPTNTKPKAVRFVAGLHRTKSENVPVGRWKKPSFDSFRKEDTYEASMFLLKNE